MASIDTLIDDIHHLFDDANQPNLNDEDVDALGRRIAEQIKRAILQPESQPKLRMSNIGTKCRRKLWYKINEFDKLEKLQPATKIKFLIGNILEELALYLAQAAGHSVERQQETLEYEGVQGHIDAVIDSHIVDVKSASSYSFKKFINGLEPATDLFGYLRQLGLYYTSLVRDGTPLKGSAFLAIDKSLGHMTLDKHDSKEYNIEYGQEIAEIKAALDLPNPPDRHFSDIPDGKSGNRKLDTECSYCEAKWLCWPGLEAYYYSGGPRYLTHVARIPKITQPDREVPF